MKLNKKGQTVFPEIFAFLALGAFLVGLGIVTDNRPTKKDVVCVQYGCFDHGKFQPNK